MTTGVRTPGQNPQGPPGVPAPGPAERFLERLDFDGLRTLRTNRVWSDADVAGVTTIEAPFVSVGGGAASFTLVDMLRCNAVPAADIWVVAPRPSPVDGFHYLARSSQIADHDRLRSDSSARLDNVWGFPGYALEESLARRSLAPLWRVFAEPVGAEFFTPLSGHVYSGVEREAARIGWSAMALPGYAVLIRPRYEGGFFVLVSAADQSFSVVRARYIHLGLGYPALRLAADLANYRQIEGDTFSAVSAYEPHEHVYRLLARSGGTVAVRGAGITAARVIQRLIDECDVSGSDIRILHLVRGNGSRALGRARLRHWADGFDYQAFNFPKGAAGGQLAQHIRDLDESERPAMVSTLGGTTSPRRRSWQRQIRRATAGGFYRLVIGAVTAINRAPGIGLQLCLDDAGRSEVGRAVEVDVMIDCTGLRGEAVQHPLFADLFDHDLARPNVLGRVVVDDHFEIREARSGAGRLYATGAVTLGSRIGPVDSFWGLTQAALCICDDLARQGLCERMGMYRSVTAWWKWTTGGRP
jgi:hypothetical protein